MEAWAKSGGGRIMEQRFTLRSEKRIHRKASRRRFIVPIARLQAGGRAAVCQTKSVCHTARNGPIAALKNGRGEWWKGRGTGKKHCARWRKNGEPALAGCFKKLLTFYLDITDLLMEVRKLACAWLS
jgi:hypothetical protein